MSARRYVYMDEPCGCEITRDLVAGRDWYSQTCAEHRAEHEQALADHRAPDAFGPSGEPGSP